MLGAHAWAQNDSLSDAGHDGAQSSGGENCPQGTAQAAGQSYSTRPPWNVAGVDYAVGYSGTLKDPFVSGNMAACVSNAGNRTNPNLYIANGDIQPCVLDHLGFSLHGGSCF